MGKHVFALPGCRSQGLCHTIHLVSLPTYGWLYHSRWGNIVLPSWRETVSLRLGLRPGGVRIRLPLRCLVAEIAQPGFRITRMALRHPRGHFPPTSIACGNPTSNLHVKPAERVLPASVEKRWMQTQSVQRNRVWQWTDGTENLWNAR